MIKCQDCYLTEILYLVTYVHAYITKPCTSYNFKILLENSNYYMYTVYTCIKTLFA